MTNKKLIFISMLVLFILNLGMVSAADDVSGQIDDISIDSSQDMLSIESNDLDDENSELLNDDGSGETDELTDNEDVLVENKTFDAIQNAIVQAAENGTVILNGTYTSTGKNMIIVNKAVTIQGVENAVLDANQFKTRFRIDSPNVIFKDICFKNFKFDDNETAIIITKNGITVNNCSFINNTGVITAIIANGGICKITDSKFSNNANAFGAIYLNKAELLISNSRFNGNKINANQLNYDKDEDGSLPSGLISAYNSKLSLSNLNFYSNKMNGLSADQCNYSVVNSVFNNTSNAIVSSNSNSSIKNSTFTRLKNGIILIGGKNTVNACNFINNAAVSVILDGDFYSGGSFTISNSKFINNTNKNGPSAIHVDRCSAEILNCIFKNNSKLTEKGIIFLETKDLVTLTNGNKTQKYKQATVFDNSLNAYKYITFVVKNSFTTSYQSGKLFTGKVIYGFNKKTLSYFEGLCYIVKGKKEYWKDFGSKINIDFSKYPVGTYKVRFTVSPDGSEDFVWRDIHAVATVKITKAKTIVKATKVTARYKRSKYFKVTIKNKASNKAASKIKVKIKVYTGKKYKIYTVKTNKKGVAKINTKKLKRGKHKVVISSGDSNYIIFKKSSIRIR